MAKRTGRTIAFRGPDALAVLEAMTGRAEPKAPSEPEPAPPFGYVAICQADGTWTDIVKANARYELADGYEFMPVYAHAQPEQIQMMLQLLKEVRTPPCVDEPILWAGVTAEWFKHRDELLKALSLGTSRRRDEVGT
jgi:hypothetical protein